MTVRVWDELREAQRLLTGLGESSGTANIGPVVCGRELLLAAYGRPEHARSLLDVAVPLLSRARTEPDLDSYNVDIVGMFLAGGWAMSDARLWLGIVEWMRWQESFATHLEEAADGFFDLAAQVEPSLLRKSGRAYAELVAGLVRVGSTPSRLEYPVKEAQRVLRAAGLEARAQQVQAIADAGSGGYVVDECGFLRGQQATTEPILATRDADGLRLRYWHHVAPGSASEPYGTVRCPRCGTRRPVTVGKSERCGCGTLLRFPETGDVRRVRCPACGAEHQGPVGSRIRCSCSMTLQVPPR
jgi:hypothetical protein